MFYKEIFLMVNNILLSKVTSDANEKDLGNKNGKVIYHIF